MKPIKSNLVFSSRVSSRDELEPDETLFSLSEEATKLANLVINRIENPRSQTAKFSKPANRKNHHDINREAGEAGKYNPRTVRNVQPDRVLSLWDRQDVFQETQAYLFKTAPDGRKLTYEELSRLFQNCRTLLRMNGGNHDVVRGDTLDETIHYSKICSLASLERGSVERLVLADRLRELRSWLWAGFTADTKRERRANYKRHGAAIRRIAAHANPYSCLKCPPFDPTKRDNGKGQSDLSKRFMKLRLYCVFPAEKPTKVTCEDVEGILHEMSHTWNN